MPESSEYYATFVVMGELLENFVKLITMAQAEIDELRAEIAALQHRLQSPDPNPT